MAKVSQAVKAERLFPYVSDMERETLANGDFNEMCNSAVVLSLTARGFLYELDGKILCTELGAEIQKLALKELEKMEA
jgi:hypothetical protein